MVSVLDFCYSERVLEQLGGEINIATLVNKCVCISELSHENYETRLATVSDDFIVVCMTNCVLNSTDNLSPF